MLGRIPVVAAALLFFAAPALARTARTDQGRLLVRRNCASCHAIGLRGESKHPEAPPFRTLHERYPVQMLAESMAEGMLTGHPAMPQFRFSARETDAIIAYLISIQANRVAVDPSETP